MEPLDSSSVQTVRVLSKAMPLSAQNYLPFGETASNLLLGSSKDLTIQTNSALDVG